MLSFIWKIQISSPEVISGTGKAGSKVKAFLPKITEIGYKYAPTAVLLDMAPGPGPTRA